LVQLLDGAGEQRTLGASSSRRQKPIEQRFIH
jgi:hypothetical protein